MERAGLWAATTNSFEAKVEDHRWNMADSYAIPSPILIADLRKNGIPEIVLNRNTTSLDKWLPNSMKYYDRGEIVSLSWDNKGLIENWKTQRVERAGYITSYRRPRWQRQTATGAQHGICQRPAQTLVMQEASSSPMI